MSKTKILEVSLLVKLESFLERARYDFDALESEADRNRRIAYWNILTGKTPPRMAASDRYA